MGRRAGRGDLPLPAAGGRGRGGRRAAHLRPGRAGPGLPAPRACHGPAGAERLGAPGGKRRCALLNVALPWRGRCPASRAAPPPVGALPPPAGGRRGPARASRGVPGQGESAVGAGVWGDGRVWQSGLSWRACRPSGTRAAPPARRPSSGVVAGSGG